LRLRPRLFNAALKAHQKARRKAPSKVPPKAWSRARSRASLKPRFRAPFKARRKARLIAPRRARFKARGKARERPCSKARRKARFKAQSKARFKPRSRPRLKAAQGAVPPPWGGRENCGSGRARPLHIDVTSPWPTSHSADCRRSRHASRGRTRHSHRDCGVHSVTQCHIQPQTQRAVQGRTRFATERASQAGTRCRTHGAIDRRVERVVGFRTDGGTEFPGLGSIDCRAEPGTHRATESRAKSLNDRHIDGGSEWGLEPRSHSRIDPPIAGSNAGSNLDPEVSSEDVEKERAVSTILCD
jgi:hypothetical protein